MTKKSDAPAIRFKGFSDAWEQRKLGELVDRVVRKNTNNESTLPLTISAQYGLVDQITYFNNRVASRDVSNYYLVLNGEFAYNKSTSDGYPFGAVKRLDLYEKGVLSTLYIVFAPKKEQQIDSDYLTVFFDTDRWHKGVAERAAEGARNHGLLNISAEDFFDIDLSVPKDIVEQKQIGAFIRQLDNLITLHQRKFEKLTNVKKSMLEKMFPQNGSSYPEIRFKGFTDPWEQRKAKEICSIGTGKSNTQDQVDDGKYPFYIRSDVPVRSNKYLYIRYYRKPHTMEQNVSKAVKLYSGDRPIGLFVEKLSYNLGKLNAVFDDIAYLFKNAGIPDFEKLPADGTVRAKFASLFRDFSGYLEAAKIQGFRWDKHTYSFKDEESGNSIEITMEFDENAFLILAQRYKELSAASPDDPGSQDIDIPYDLVGYLTEIDTGVIDADYMNSRFDKYLKLIRQEGSSEESIEQAKAELHKTFAALTQEEQKYANIFLHDIERGDVIAEDGKTLRDYITEYQFRAKDDQIHRFATIFGLDEDKLRNMMGLNLNEATINEFGRFDELKKSVDKTKAKAFFEAYEQTKLIPPKVNMKTDQLLRQFILTGGFEVDMP